MLLRFQRDASDVTCVLMAQDSPFYGTNVYAAGPALNQGPFPHQL
jgi:hypothetical protein